MGCCISRLKMDQPYEQDDVKSAVPKKSTILNRSVFKIFNMQEIKRTNPRIKDSKKK